MHSEWVLRFILSLFGYYFSTKVWHLFESGNGMKAASISESKASFILVILCSIAVRVLACSGEDPRFKTHFEPKIGRSLAHYPPSSEWGPGGNTGEIKAARKGTGHPTSQSRWPRTSVPSNRHSPNVRIVYGTCPLPLV